jgi:hypothetical protein
METQSFVKQFPQMMAGKTILYVHGFASSGQSGTVVRLRTVLPQARIVAPDLPLHPEEAMSLLHEVCEKEQPDLILGTSMGGMYAEMLRGYERILVNPAFEMGDTMGAHGMVGAQHYQNPRQDGVQDFIVTKALVKEYRQMTEQCFAGADDPLEQQRVFGLFGDQDPLVHTQPLFNRHYRQSITFHGEHRMDDRSFMQSVVPVIRWVDDRQERRGRPIIYIGIETLRDERGQARPSAQKAVRTLAEQYSIYFVTPGNEQSATSSQADDTAWLEQYMGVYAWHHIVHTHQRQLLYGDYLIAPKPTNVLHPDEADLLAQCVDFGSEQMKTWDDTLVFFQRLGGQ